MPKTYREEVRAALQQMATDLEITHNTSDDERVCHTLGNLRSRINGSIRTLDVLIEEDEIRACDKKFDGHAWNQNDHTIHTRCLHCQVEKLLWELYVCRRDNKPMTKLQLLKLDMEHNGGRYTHQERRRMMDEICEYVTGNRKGAKD